MKLSFILLAACIINCNDCLSQMQWPPAYEIKSDTAIWQDITTSYWMILEDKQGKLKLDDVLALHESGKFHSISKGYDTSLHTYWIAYRLQNMMNRDAKISLNSMSDLDEFYVKSDSAQWKHFISGRSNVWEKKDGLKIADCIPVVMQPGESYTVYQRISNTEPGLHDDFQVAIVNTDKVIQEYYINDAERRDRYFYPYNLQEAFIIGMIFLAAFMNFFFYRIVKEKVYLYFALFILFIGVNRIHGISVSYFVVFDQHQLQYVSYLRDAWIFISFFLVQFFRHFLGTSTKFPFVDKWFFRLVIAFCGLNLATMIFRLFEIQDTQQLRPAFKVFIFAFVPVVLILLQWFCLKLSGKANRFVLLGSLPLLSIFILSQFFTPEGLNINPTNRFIHLFYVNYRLIEAVCLAIMLVSFTWVLFMRFIDLRKENAQQALDKERFAKEKEMERNELIAGQKIQLEKDVTERTAELKHSLEELKATQSQLIQSEKMASLGELTAGIAHEIQNPLNFVNNFSEVNDELINEMNDEMDKGNIREAKSIAYDLQQNLEKINHHGKRADAIVKNMLQHSRSSSSQKELTDINRLADEYLRLSYHGMRAKEKNFNATIKTDFDRDVSSVEGKMNIIPQDIGRVLLNLYNNAFYALAEKMKNPQPLKGSGEYQPSVMVSTRYVKSPSGDLGVLISVKDNGDGIPQKIVDKIFQPFFTTKPTGQGTGLGLSLSYDIVKAHGGEIKVETKKGDGAEFTINLPYTS